MLSPVISFLLGNTLGLLYIFVFKYSSRFINREQNNIWQQLLASMAIRLTVLATIWVSILKFLNPATMQLGLGFFTGTLAGIIAVLMKLV